jgi:hypothetical protein
VRQDGRLLAGGGVRLHLGVGGSRLYRDAFRPLAYGSPEVALGLDHVHLALPGQEGHDFPVRADDRSCAHLGGLQQAHQVRPGADQGQYDQNT